MFDLFNPYPGPTNMGQTGTINMNVQDIPVSGLTYLPNFISNKDEASLITAINNSPWLSDIKRRVQHYGYKYDYKARSIDYKMYIGALPAWAMPIANRLFLENHISRMPDQLIINEYLPGQGIANHVDCEPCFGETIISLSLGSKCVMDFIHVKTKQKIEVLLEPRSLVVISGDARHLWTHGIASRKCDVINGRKYDRELRISMTFRNVILKNEIASTSSNI